MIDRTIHWDPSLQQSQRKMLDSLPENQREFMAFTIRTTNVSLHYYRDINADPTEEDFEEWLSILPKELSDKYRIDGYAKSKGVLPLKRHTAERNDFGLSEYMRQSLTSEDYKRWMDQGKLIDSPQA